MRAILRANEHTSRLWIETGEVFELPDMTDPTASGSRPHAPPAVRAEPARTPRRFEPTGPTDEGGPAALVQMRRPPPRRDDDLEDSATDEVSRGSFLRLVHQSPAAKDLSTDSLPPLGEVEGAPSGRARTNTGRFARMDDEMSTGLYEPMSWDEAEPYSEVPEPAPEGSPFARLSTAPLPPRSAAPAPLPPRSAVPVAPAPLPPRSAVPAAPARSAAASRPPAAPAPLPPPPAPTPAPARLSVVRQAQTDASEDFAGIVAMPLPAPPRPAGPEWWPLAMRAAVAPPEWYDPERNYTAVLIDPTRRRAPWTFWACVAADLAAWAAGFLATFTTSALGMVVAMGLAVLVG